MQMFATMGPVSGHKQSLSTDSRCTMHTAKEKPTRTTINIIFQVSPSSAALVNRPWPNLFEGQGHACQFHVSMTRSRNCSSIDSEQVYIY